MPTSSKAKGSASKKKNLSRRAKRKKIRYREMSFKLTQGQLDGLKKLCVQHKTTPVRFLKSMVNKQVENYRTSAPVSYVTENQLNLFDEQMFTD